MQSFYPSPPRHRWQLTLLAALVLLLHGMVLQGVRWDAPPPDNGLRSWQVQIPPSVAVTAQPATDAPAPAVAKAAIANAPVVKEPEPAAAPPAESATVVANAPAPAPAPEPEPEPLLEPQPDVAAAPEPANPPQAAPTVQTNYRWPAPAKLVFDFVGETKGIRFSADGDMLWQHDGQQYQLRQEVRHLLLGSRSQTSIGQLTEQGLQPSRFGDKFKQEVAAHFERSKGVVSFSANTPSQPLQEGAQDRLSLFFQLAALMEGNPEMRQPGHRVQLQVASARSAEVWAFAVDKRETLKLPIGLLPSLKLVRLPVQQYDQTVEIWLSPGHAHLPVRVRVVQTNGDVLEQFLRKLEKP